MVNIGLYVSVHRSSSYKNLVKEKLEFFDIFIWMYEEDGSHWDKNC